MNLIHYIKLLLRHKTWLILVPLICASTVFFLTKKSKKQYTSSTTLYTGVASGYSITSTEDERLDYFAVNNAFDNLMASAKSRETIQAVALHLLAEHLLLKKPDFHVLSAEGFDNLKKLVGQDIINTAQKLGNEQAVYNYLNVVFATKTNNPIANILNNPGSFYSIDDLKSSLVVTRLNASDILQVVYTCTDPAVCLRTLELHSTVFTENYKRLKSDQTYSAVQYFEAKLAEAKAKLQKSEDDLKVFGQKNRVINYYEQTRYIAQSKEQLEKEIYAEKVTQKGSEQALGAVEKKLNSRNQQIDNSLNVINTRQHLSQAKSSLERARLYGNNDKMAKYTARVKSLEDSLKTASDDYLKLNYTLETVPRSNLIQEWVDNAVTGQKATAGLDVLDKQRQNYLSQIDQFAPLGSTLKRLDRQVDINEKEFLSILHGLNLARLRQSNIALNSNIVVQDKPFFPLRAQPSTRGLLIIISFILGFVSVVSVIVGRELMDSSVRTTDRAEKSIGLPLAGISIAHGAENIQAYQKQLMDLLAERLTSTILPFISADLECKGKATLALVATRQEVYNALDVQLLHGALLAVFKKVFWVVPVGYDNVFQGVIPTDFMYTYTPTLEQLNYKDICDFSESLIPQDGLVVYVSPNLSLNSLPVAVAKSSAMMLYAFNASHTNQQADKQIIAKAQNAVQEVPFYTWLVNVDEANIDSSVGEISKKRSWLRRKIKKMITLNLR
ncbi:GumC family protein [Mucilaginibacter celer]|uniref:Polysaccharide chain length determinant N-terminal domain-containing protein n=1 Tax=Mucilaginibacter celer TaxID=2305508 RepID=A0A494VPT0_9SPHI|nr:hypothetical protein [Mucilaginibacter celer]AYL95160.1 hypothetical protein HYN43_007565 [Mucilaginibacter celer]